MRNRVIHRKRCLIEQLGISEVEKQTLIHKKGSCKGFCMAILVRYWSKAAEIIGRHHFFCFGDIKPIVCSG